ncbi:MAG: hypothetical protein ACK5H1_07785 [Tenacibaculum sp.]
MANNPINTVDPDGGCPCSECPENCQEGVIDPLTDSSSAFPETSGLQELREVTVQADGPTVFAGGSLKDWSQVNWQWAYQSQIADIQNRTRQLQKDFLDHSVSQVMLFIAMGGNFSGVASGSRAL